MSKVMALVALLIMLVGVCLCWLGFHSMDMGQNTEFLAYHEGIDLSQYEETMANGNTIPIQEMYRLGIATMAWGFATLVVASLILIGEQMLMEDE